MTVLNSLAQPKVRGILKERPVTIALMNHTIERLCTLRPLQVNVARPVLGFPSYVDRHDHKGDTLDSKVLQLIATASQHPVRGCCICVFEILSYRIGTVA